MYQQQRHQQQPPLRQPYQDNRDQMDPIQVQRLFRNELVTLTFNSKPIITSLTITAEKNPGSAKVIVPAIEERLRSAPSNQKLPVLYLIDSIIKVAGGPYLNLFERVIVNMFLDAYAVVDSTTKAAIEKLLRTWPSYHTQLFPREIVDRIERGIQSMRQPHGLNGQPPVNPRPDPRDPRNANNMQYGQAPNRPQESDNVLLQDIQLLILQKQQAMIMNPADQSHAKQVGILQQLETIVKTTQLTPDKANMIRQQLAQLWTPPAIPPPPAMPPSMPLSMPMSMPGAMMPPPPSMPLGHIQTPMAPFPNMPPMIPPFQHVASPQGSMPNPPPMMAPHMPTSTPISIPPNNVLYGAPPPPPPQTHAPVVVPPAASDLFASLMQSGLLGPNGTLTNQLLQNVNMNRASPSPLLGAMGSPIPPPMPAIVPMEAPVANVRADQSELDQSVMSIGLIDLNSQDIQRRRPAAVQVMYGTPPLQCNQCGYRCPKSADAQKKMDSHLDWHFRQNRRMKDKAKKSHSRSWLVGEEDWIHSREGDLSQSQQPVFFDFGSGVNKTSKDEQALQEEIAAMREQIVSETSLAQSLRGGDPEITQAMALNTITKGCSICKEKFIKVWNDTEEEWSYKNAVVVDKLIYHATCHADLVRSNQRQAAAAAAAAVSAAASTPTSDPDTPDAPATTLSPPMSALTHEDDKKDVEIVMEEPVDGTPQDQEMQQADALDVPASLKRKMEQELDEENQIATKKTILAEES
ncbi:hypothetical protein BGZ52_005798 [Haplosporangium bisporale]|nr:hypothetical protein BGZ52_005798 [Haplosporangium bisporale]KAF9216209.1 hypothetical protein BGZ59_010632 [Podila verticillata]KAI9241732.1 MAG: hypothetical protein BYD32DRAFT_404953 [Podila humilis]